jgi:capsular exopolysaccharide synthesis family protein
MSKIFEALQKTRYGIPDMGVPLLSDDAAGSSIDHSSPTRVPHPEPLAEVKLIPTEHLNATTSLPETDSSDSEKSLAIDPTREVRAVPVRLVATNPVLPFDTRSRRAVEQYRMIRTKIHHHSGKPQIIAVTSAGSGDGKTVTSINIAGAMSLKAGAQVLLIDADLRRSSIARMLGFPSEPGLTDVISQTCDLEHALIRIQQFPNCYVLPAGKPSKNPPELLDSATWRTLCDTLRIRFQYVILDSPPVASVADYDLIETVSDGVLMVVRPDHTNRATFKKAMTAIPLAKMLGFVLNGMNDWFLWNVQAGYSYTYYDSLDMTQMQAKSIVTDGQ